MDCWIWVVVLFIVYKVLDRVIRWVYIRGLTKRYVLITGCDMGLGHECAKRLDRMGVNVFAGCLTEMGETSLRKQSSERLKTVSLDVTNLDSIRKAVLFVQSNLPSDAGLWGVVNNAGIGGNIGPIEWLIKQDYVDVLNINLHGLIDVTVAFLPLIKKGHGRVVNMASVLGRYGLGGTATYCISKYGVEAFSDILRKQLRVYKCSVHIIEPGFHKTNIMSEETITASLTHTWDRLDPQLKKEYGQEFFEKTRDEMLVKFLQQISSDRIEDVVNAYEHALLAVCPRARYVVGNDARFWWLPLQSLPEWLGDWLPELIARNAPIPAAIKEGYF